jgi:hypothetical protein
MLRFVRPLAVALLMAMLAACQLKSTPVLPNFVTVDPSAFALKSVDRFNDPNGGATTSMIVVVKATYTNQEANPETISPDKFALLDPNLMAVYTGLSGGDINIPSMPLTRLDPGKSTEIVVGFRVPGSMSGGRLVYRP